MTILFTLVVDGHEITVWVTARPGETPRAEATAVCPASNQRKEVPVKVVRVDDAER